MLFGSYEPTVRAPTRLIQKSECFLGQLVFAAAIDIHNPDVVSSPAIRREGDAFAIGRKTRLLLIGKAFGNSGRRSPSDRHSVNVAEQVKRDEGSIARDIHVHPRPIVDSNGNGSSTKTARRADVPFVRFCKLFRVDRRLGCDDRDRARRGR